MGVLSDALAWLTSAENYSGPSGISTRMLEHVQISVQPLVLAALVAIPVGMWIGHRRRFEFLVISIGNLGRALPSFGILAIFFIFTFSWPGDLGYWAIFFAMFFLAIPPILTNTYVGIKGVDPDTVEAARGMGLREREVLLALELPLAVPLIVAGMRTAAVQVVATATLGAVTSWGGLGRFIVDGFAVQDNVQILAGAILVALLAIVTEVVFGRLQRALAPKISSGGSRKGGSADDRAGEGAARVAHV
jgi:osmoprotectant transport system permease protein